MTVGETRNAEQSGSSSSYNEDQICVVGRTRAIKGIPMYYIENILSRMLPKYLTIKELM